MYLYKDSYMGKTPEGKDKKENKEEKNKWQVPLNNQKHWDVLHPLGNM